MGDREKLGFTFVSEEGDSYWGFLRFYIGSQLVTDPEHDMNLLRFAQGLERDLPLCGDRVLPDREDSWASIWFDLCITWPAQYLAEDEEHSYHNSIKLSVLNDEECFDEHRFFLVEEPELGLETYLYGPTDSVPGETRENVLSQVQFQTLPYGTYRDFIETVLASVDTSKF